MPPSGNSKAQKGLEVDGEIGQHTFDALAPSLDAFGHSLLDKVRKQLQEPTGKRQQIVHAAFVGYTNRDRITYTMKGERMQGVRDKIHPPQFPTTEDCSSFATWCYFVADAPDPNGRGFDGQGYTGTMIGHGTEVKEAKPGDLIFYGHSHGDINHVTVYVGNGKVISHGQDSGPMLYPMNYSRPGGGVQQIRSYV